MKVYALVGKSGTGKSYQSVNLCRELNIETIIDDGLFINGNKGVTGISAKRQKTWYRATRTAIFYEEAHRKEVADKIKEENPASILILGTSEKMVNIIVERLELPPISQMINIEDITTEKERAEAYKQRHEHGKHVIPAPSFQLKKDFSGYFVDPMKIVREWSWNKNNTFQEKSVVRPSFSYRGDYILSDRVVKDIIENVLRRTKGMVKAVRVDSYQGTEGLEIYLGMVADKSCNIIEAARAFQSEVYDKIDYMTGINVVRIDVEIKGIV